MNHNYLNLIFALIAGLLFLILHKKSDYFETHKKSVDIIFFSTIVILVLFFSCLAIIPMEVR